jgi:NAD(P)-dependent dehydrogenase (short-subunit alcohol dehydrogenase family)
MTLALNHLGYFLLTDLLLDTLKASAPARIINVASDAHEMTRRFDFDDPQGRSRYRRLGANGQSGFASGFFTFLAPMAHPGLAQYVQSKLANLLFTYELARRLEGTGVTVNAVHPGFVASEFTAGNGIFGWFMRFWARVFATTVDEGAKTSIYLATSPEVEGVTGKYFAKQKAIASSAASRDETASRRLWQLSEEWTGREARS